MKQLQTIKNLGVKTLIAITPFLLSVQAFAQDNANYTKTKQELEAVQSRTISGVVMVAGILFSMFIVIGVVLQGFKWMSDPDNVNVKKSLMVFFFGALFGGFMIFQAPLVANFITYLVNNK